LLSFKHCSQKDSESWLMDTQEIMTRDINEIFHSYVTREIFMGSMLK